MPRHTFVCPDGHCFDAVVNWDVETQECMEKRPGKGGRCHKTAERVFSWGSKDKTAISPVVVHVDASGNYRFPGSADSKPPKGFEKVELRTIREMERFEGRMNQKFRGEAERHQERESVAFAQAREARRSELRQRMATMSNYGKEFARQAMKELDNRPRRSLDPGFHLDILANDQSNRENYRDERTGWKTRRA